MGSKTLLRFVLTLGLAAIGLAALLGLLTDAQGLVHAAASQPLFSSTDAQDVARPLPRLEPSTGLAWSSSAMPSKAPLLAVSASTVITVCKPTGVCDYSSVQDAVSGASSGDVIKVAEGVYTGTGACVVEIAKTLTLQGGYTTTAGATGWMISDPDGHPTVLDGEGSRQVVCINAGDPTVEGFHVRDGQGTDGAGVYVAGGEPLVRRNRIYGNAATTGGGGVYVAGGSPTLENSLIYANTATDGGGVYVASGSARIHYNTFYDNEATTGSGGGLHLASGSSPVISASIVVSNVAGLSGGGLFKAASVSGDQVLYNDVFGNSPQNYAGFGGDGNVLVNNIHQAPEFVGPVAVGDLAAANFRLRPSSPCIGQDSEDYPDTGPDDDYDGYGRPFGPWPDMGAHEFFAGTCFARIDSGVVYTTVQEAVDNSVTGGLVRVAGYCTGTSSSAVAVDRNLDLRGGYTLTNWSDPDSALYLTVLDGENARRVLDVGDFDVIIEGFDIRYGSVLGVGAGINLDSGSNSTIRGNRIYSNTARGSNPNGRGGGIFVGGGTHTIVDNQVYSNTAETSGGAVYVDAEARSDVVIENSQIHHNFGEESGGGITINNNHPNQGVATVRNSEIYANATLTTGGDYVGGGVYCGGSSSCVVQDNAIYGNATTSGGGVNSASDDSVVVEGNRIYGNLATAGGGGGGGGVAAEGVAIIRNNVVSANVASNSTGRGGGVYVSGSSSKGYVIVEANDIYGNTSADFGGGVALRYGGAIVRNNLIYSNTARRGGGCSVRDALLENNTIYGNEATVTSYGGGVHHDSTHSGYIRNNVIVSNTGWGIEGDFGANSTYNDVWANTAGQCKNALSCDAANGNISVGPQFQDLAGLDFRLQASSPCRDAVLTTTTSLYAPYDYDHYARPFAQYADMGAHEFYAGTCFAILSTGVDVGGRVYTTVQAAVLSATAEVDDVLVAGVCAGTDAMVTIDKSLALRGGYTKSNWEDPSAPTILDAQGLGRVVNVTASSPSTVTVERFVLTGGDAGAGDGGGIYVATAISPVVQNIIFYSNTASNGGGFASSGGNPRLYNNTFVYNAATNGGGIYLDGGFPVVSNTIAVSNTGSGVHTAGGSSPSLAYNDVWGNSGGSNGGYGGGLSQGGPTDFSLPPRFDDLAGPIFRLAFDSPCVHTGDPNTGPMKDFEGDARPGGSGYDIGADEATDYLGVDLKAEKEEDVTIPGRVIQYTYRLTNTGTRVGDFAINNTLVVDPIAGDTTAGEWQSGPASSYAGLAPGEAVEVPITVAVPTKALSGTQATLFLTSTYQSGSGGSIYFFDVASTTILVKADWGVVLEPPGLAEYADPGDVVTHTHTLTNAGGADIFTFTLNSSLGWATVVPPGPVSLGSGKSMPIEIRVTVPTTAAGGIVETTVLIANSVEAAGVGRVVRDAVTDTVTVNSLPGDRYVSPDGNDNARYIGGELVRLNSCRDSDYPCGTVAQAVEQAGGGEWVKVAEGVYTEYNISINGAIVVQGGYAPPDWGIFDPDEHLTVIDAQELGRVLRIEGGNPVIGGITLQNGRVSNVNGGGVYVSAAAEPTLRRVVITGNAARRVSAGGSGGGLYNAGSDLTLERSTIANNEADRFGGGLYNHTGGPRVWNNLFYDNVAEDDGGGFYNAGGNPWVWHDTFVRNAADRGGGLYLSGGSPVVSNTIVVSNTAVVTGGGIYKQAAGAALDYNDVADNVPSQYAGTEGGSHSIEATPHFMDAASGDFHLLGASLCRDSGDSVDPALLAEDMDKQPRTMNGIPDIGADEYQRPGVALVSLYPDQVGDQGEWVTYTHRLTNTGNYNDYYVLTWQSAWSVTVEGQATQPVTVPMLSSNEATAIVATVRVPDDVLSGTMKRTVVTATSQVAVSQGETDVYTTAESFTTAGRDVDVSLEPDGDGWADRNKAVVYDHKLVNTGNYTDSFTLTFESSDLDWGVQIVSPASQEATLAKGAWITVSVVVTVADNALEVEKHLAIVTATSQTDGDVWAVVTDTTIAQRELGVELKPGSALGDYTGECVVHNHTLTNTGNYTDTYVFTYTSALGWPIKIENAVPPVEVEVEAWPPYPDGPGSTAIEVEVCIPDPPIAFGRQVETMVITATSVSSPALSSSVRDVTTATQREGVELWPDYTYNYDPADVERDDSLSVVRRLVLTTTNQLVTYTHTLRNNTYSNSTDTFTLTHSVGPVVSWDASVSPVVTGEMFWHEEMTVTVSLTAEASLEPPNPATAATVWVTGTSWFSPTGPHGQAMVEDVVVVNQAVDATLSPGGTRHGPTQPYPSPIGQPSPPDGSVVYTHTLTNAGNYTDSFVLDYWSSWNEAVDFSGVDFDENNDWTPDIGPGVTYVITVEATVPFVRCGMTGTVVITATSRTPNEGLYSYDPVASAQDAIVIDPVYYAELTPVEVVRRYVSTDTATVDETYTRWLTNWGNCTNTFSLDGQGSFTPVVQPQSTGVLSSFLDAGYNPTMVVVTVTVPQANPSTLITGTVEITADGALGGTSDFDIVTDTIIVNQRVEAAFEPDFTETVTQPGTVYVEYTHVLTNAGNYEDNFLLSWSNGDGWSVQVDNPGNESGSYGVTLGAQETRTVEVRVEVGPTVPPTLTNRTWVTATSQTPDDEEALAAYSPIAVVTDTTLVRRPDVSIYPDFTEDVSPGDTYVYTHTLENSGGQMDTYTVTCASLDRGWLVGWGPQKVENLSPGQTQEITVSVAVPPDAEPGWFDVAIVTATSAMSYPVEVYDVATDTTNVLYELRAELSPTEPRSADPDTTIEFTHRLTNTGNYTESFELTTDQEFSDVDVVPQQVELAPQEWAPVTVTVAIPAYAPAGDAAEQVQVGVYAIHKVLGERTQAGSVLDTINISYTTGARHVDYLGGTDDGNNCTLEDERPPCRTVQHAVDQASPGDTVKVAGGTYIGAPGATEVVSVSKSVDLIGGYAIDDWNTSLPDDRVTTLDGQNLRRVMALGTGVTSTIEGFRMSGGYVVGDGAGLYIAEGATPTVRLNHIFDNTAFEDVGSSLGGGVYYGGGDGVIERNRIYGNEADLGGGLYLQSGEPLVQNNLVYNNGSDSGGGFYNYEGIPRIWNNTFYGNAAGFNGAGGLYSLGGRLVVSNTIVAANDDFGIRIAGAASYTLAYNDVWGNDRGDYSQVVYTGTGTISEDPRLADPSVDDLRLTFNSPCVDAGDPGALWPDVDYEGNDRPLRGRHDIGAYEYGFVSTKVVTDASPANTTITYVVQIDNVGNVAHTVVMTDVLHGFLNATGDLTYTTGSGLYNIADKMISWTGLVVGQTVELITFTAHITDGVANYTPITNVAWVDQGSTAVATTIVRPQLGTRYVALSGDNTNNDCRIMAEPCQTVQYAVGQALDGDEVKVAAGTHTGLVTVTKRITLTGGYVYVDASDFDWNTFDPDANQTTLEALSGGPGVIVDSGTIVLAGFHIVNGSDGVNVTAGGDLTLHRSWIYDNTDGVAVADGTSLLVNSVIARNTGTGLQVAAGSDGTVVHSTFDDNTDGAVVAGTARFTNTIFSNHDGVGVNATGSAWLWNTLWSTNTPNTQGTVFTYADVFSSPMFVDPGTMDYHILENSGAVDQGVVVPWVTEDIDGEARVVREGPDIGADEFPLGLTKYGPPTADPGQLITYTIELKAVDVGLVITDELPVHLTYAGAVTCTAPTCTYLPSERTIRWAGDSAEIVLITYTGHLDPWLGKDVVVANTAELLRQGRRDESVAWETVINQVPGTRHVDPSGFNVHPTIGTNNNCLVDSMPCRTVQWAVDQAMDGDTIKVAAGTYTSTAAQVVYVNKAITLTGGCTTADWTCDPEANPTYLDGQDSRRVMYIANAPGMVTVDGFHVRNGYVSISTGNGAGIFVDTASVTLAHNQIYDNQAPGANGGGVYLNGADVTLTSNRIYANTTSGNGGGVFSWQTDFSAANNIIVANQAADRGDGIFFSGNQVFQARMRHNTVADNVDLNPADSDMGIYVNSYVLVMTNTVVAGHDVGVRRQGGSVTAERTLWYDNTDDTSGTVANNDPMYGDPEFADPGTYDYHIRPGSAAFDQGVDAGVTTDVDGEVRPMGLGFDVGADELRVSLDVIKRAEPDLVQAEDPLTYTIQITNTGQLTLTAAITDILPSNVMPNDPVIWTSVVIIPGAVWTDDIRVQTLTAGQLTNVVKVTTAEGATGVFTETSVVTSTPDIVVTPLALSQMLAPGGTATRTLTISNVGRAALDWSLAEVPAWDWLDETPASGTVLPSQDDDVTVDFDATGLADGTYTTTLRISSNDLETPEVDVSTVLTVCTPVSGLSFTYDPTTPEVGQPVTFTAVATGTEPIIYAWDLGDGNSGSGMSVSHTYDVSDTYAVVVTATNCYGTGEAVHAEDVWVFGTPDINVSPAALNVSLKPGETTSRTLTIENVGTWDLTWSLVEDPDEDWLSVDIESGVVPPSSSTAVVVNFDASGLNDDSYNTTLRISSDDPDESPWNVPVTLNVGTAGHSIFLPLVLKNS